MHDNIAIRLLKLLNEDELKNFSDYIRSPYFNKSGVLIRLFESISKHSPEFSSRILKKENLYSKIYPGKPYNEQNIKNRMAELSSLIKDFLSRNNFENDYLAKKINLVKELYRRKEFLLSEKQLEEAFGFIEKGSVMDSDYFNDKFTLLTELHLLNLARDKKQESLTIAAERVENIIFYFLVTLTQLEMDVINNSIEGSPKGGWNASLTFLEKFEFEPYLELVKTNRPGSYPVIAIYYYGYLSLRSPGNEENFYKLKDLIFKHYLKFKELDLYNFWSILVNTAFLLHLSKGKKFVEEGHEVDKFFIENSLYPKDRPFSSIAYKNAVTIAVTVGNIAWAEKFANDFKNKLIEDTRENRFNYAMSIIEFEKKNYNRSLDYCSITEFNDIFDKINVRLCMLKNYYELGLWEQVESLLDSLKHFVDESRELPEYTVERLKKMIKYTAKASGAKFNGKKIDFAYYKEAENNKPFMISEWVIEKIKEVL